LLITEGSSPDKIIPGRVSAQELFWFLTYEECQTWINNPKPVPGRTQFRVCIPFIPGPRPQ
jgi:hypothetical protein